MSDPLTTKKDFEISDELLNEMLNIVIEEEGTLAGGKELRESAQTIKRILDTRVSIDYPDNFFIHLTAERFEEYGYKLNAHQRSQLEETHNFFMIEIPVTIHAQEGVMFRHVSCELIFGPEASRPIVQTIFPEDKWHPVVEYGAELGLALDANLKWQLGLPDLSSVTTPLPGSIDLSVKNENKYGAYIRVPQFKFEIGRSEISASGPKSRICLWHVSAPELKKVQSLSFIVIFKVPKSIKEISLEARIWAEPDIAPLALTVRQFFDELSSRLQRLLNLPDTERKGADLLPRGIGEVWDNLELPIGKG